MNSKKPKRKKAQPKSTPPAATVSTDNTTPIGNWFRDRGVRETVESIIVAILLALMFRSFEAEAYIIPTGSMANNLQGRHIDIPCPQCGYQFRAGASTENPTQARANEVREVACPICQYVTKLDRRKREQRSFSGDRILVNKYIYDFVEPNRFDVIVFKNPNNGKQNYIKRLIGLPREGVLIESGDIYTYDHQDESFAEREIARKLPFRLLAMLLTVDDTDFVAPQLVEVGWPSRWNQWHDRGGPGDWSVNYVDDQPVFETDGSDEQVQMLRYRHLVPRPVEWDQINEGNLPERFQNGTPPGELITDYYAYNDFELARPSRMAPGIGYSGMHWVGDLALKADITIESESGKLILDLVEGGVHFTCTIDVASGTATLAASDSSVEFRDQSGTAMTKAPQAETGVTGPGSYEVMFANADNKLYLWVDGRHVEINGSTYVRPGKVRPRWTRTDGLDAEPLGIGTDGVAMSISRLQVFRDIYYTSVNGSRLDRPDTSFEYHDLRAVLNTDDLRELRGNSPRSNSFYVDDVKLLFRSPEKWDSSFADKLFASRHRDETFVFKLQEDQFFPMGDNSPASLDARVWNGPHFLDRSYLLGKALFIYWPHAKTKPVPFFPHFERMRFIR